MKKKLFLILVVACACLLVGCSKPPDTPNTLPPSLMINDVLYFYTGEEVSAKIAEESIVGNVTSTVSLSEMPIENGQSNMEPALGCAFAQYEGNYVVRMEEKWILFEMRGSPATLSPVLNARPAFAIDLTKLPKKYTPEEAAANGDYVNVHGQISNEAKLTEFVNAVTAKKSAAIRMVQYTTEGDPIISDVIFDGNKFTVWNDTTRDAFGEQKITKSEYERMLEYNREGTIYVFLTNEETITDELYDNGPDGHLLYYKIAPAMPGDLPKVYPENDELNMAFMNAELLPEVFWETDNKTDLPKKGKTVSIPSGRLVFAFLPTRPHEEKSIFLDEAILKKIVCEVNTAKVLSDSSQINWAQADFQDYWLNLYVLTDAEVYNCIRLWGPIRYKDDVYVNISVMSVDSTYAFETWRIESSTLGQILIDTWGPKFDLERFHDVTRIDMRVLNFHDTAKVGNKATLEGSAAKDIAERMLETAKIVTGYGKCGYNVELSFTFSDGTTELGWLNGDSCPGIAMDSGPNIMFDKEITRELYKLLDYGENFISD